MVASVEANIRSYYATSRVLDRKTKDSMPTVTAPTLQLLAWIAEQRRSYAETMDAWKTSCPRLTVWEDAVADGLVRVESGNVALTAAGTELLSEHAVR
jgi:hypothetical protein